MANVVEFPVIQSFRLADLKGNDGQGLVGRWLSEHPGARARLRVRVRNLQRISRTDWTKKQFRHIEDGVFEIKWEYGKLQFRIAGFDHQAVFQMLIGYTHKQGVYNPREWLTTAKRRKGEVQRGEWRTIDFEP